MQKTADPAILEKSVLGLSGLVVFCRRPRYQDLKFFQRFQNFFVANHGFYSFYIYTRIQNSNQFHKPSKETVFLIYTDKKFYSDKSTCLCNKNPRTIGGVLVGGYRMRNHFIVLVMKVTKIWSSRAKIRWSSNSRKGPLRIEWTGSVLEETRTLDWKFFQRFQNLFAANLAFFLLVYLYQDWNSHQFHYPSKEALLFLI